MMNIPEGYYRAIAYDPPDDQLSLYMDALKGLTPRGRGEPLEEDGNSESEGNAFF